MRPEERESWRRADARFAELLDLPESERPRALGEREPDPEIRRRVAALLAAAGTSGPLDLPPAWADVDGAEPPAAAASLSGRRFGAYELDDEIGRGGMAVVYRAHRVDGAFAQEVAVKVLGIGLLPTGAGERFGREQQILARLRHPHIATMLDGGVAEDGTPFLVMERIEGRRIDRFADEERLGTRARIEILLQVVSAVAFAHRNLVVHRDIKPGNVLVDASGQAKLLDFGIAKLLETDGGPVQPTLAQDRFLTPGFAAPEQISGGAITTSTDVFALGKLLERLVEPAARPAGSDLGNVVAQATRAEPERRYADARALAEDLRSWLDGRPVRATPPSLGYRIRKAARRHRGKLLAGLSVALVAAAGLYSTLRQQVRATREARNAAAVNAFLTDLFEAHDPDRAGGDDPPASELFRRGAAKARAELAGEPELQAELLQTIGRIQVERGLYDDADASLAEALRLRLVRPAGNGLDVARIESSLGDLRMQQGELAQGIVLLRRALAAFDRVRPPDDPERLDIAVGLAEMLGMDQSYAEARDLSRAILGEIPAGSDELEGPRAAAHQTLGIALHGLGDLDGAAASLRRAIEIQSAGRERGGIDLAIFLNDFGLVLLDRGDYREAEAAFAESLEIKRKLLGGRHVQVISSLTNLGYSRTYQQRMDEGVADHLAALALARDLFSPPHRELADAIGGAATALKSAGRLAQALPLFEEALRLSRSVDEGSRTENYPSHVAQYGSTLLEVGRPAEAERALTEAITIYEQSEGQGGTRIHVARARRAKANVSLRRYREAVDELALALPALSETPQGWGRREFVSWQLAAAEAQLALGRSEEARRALATVRARLTSHPDERDADLDAELERLAELARR